VTRNKKKPEDSTCKVLNKKPDLFALINAEKPDNFAGTETWLTPNVMNNEIIPPKLGYKDIIC